MTVTEQYDAVIRQIDRTIDKHQKLRTKAVFFRALAANDTKWPSGGPIDPSHVNQINRTADGRVDILWTRDGRRIDLDTPLTLPESIIQ